MGAAAYVVAPLTSLMGNDYEKVDIEGVDLTIATAEEPKTATLERVWLDDPRPRAGRTVPLKVLLRTYRGEEVVRTVPIEIPANATRHAVAAGVRRRRGSAQAEQREARSPQPRSVAQMIRALNKARRNNTLYVKLLGSDAGAVVNGELLSSLPPSVLGVLEADRNGGNFNPLHSATLGEWELPTEHAVSRFAHADDQRLAELSPAFRTIDMLITRLRITAATAASASCTSSAPVTTRIGAAIRRPASRSAASCSRSMWKLAR